MKGRLVVGSTIRVVSVAWLTAICFSSAQAQFYAPWWGNPPLPSYQLVVAQERWDPVSYEGPLSYKVNGIYYTVDSTGQHWRWEGATGEPVPYFFAEPFDSFGCRIVKPAPPLPPGTEYTICVGAKLHAVVSGRTQFATWVHTPRGSRRLVWVQIEDEAPMVINPTGPILYEAPIEGQSDVKPNSAISPVPDSNFDLRIPQSSEQ